MGISGADAGGVHFCGADFLHGQRYEFTGLSEEIFDESVLKTFRAGGASADSGKHRMLSVVWPAPQSILRSAVDRRQALALSISASDSLPTLLSIFTGSCIPSFICIC